MMSTIPRLGGVLGYPVAHSLSPAMQNAALRELGLHDVYLPLEVHPERLSEAVSGLRAIGAYGLNVTVPHKEASVALCRELSPTARMIGAVNTLIPIEGGWRGENTDAPGLLRALAEDGVNLRDSRCIILGAGGAARATAFALYDAGAKQIVIANRTLSRAQELAAAVSREGVQAVALALPTQDDRETDRAAERHASQALAERLSRCDLLVNTTSVGLGDSPQDPLPQGLELRPETFVCDLVYRPGRTPLLIRAHDAGCQTQDGLQLLLHQGALALEYWTGRPAPLEVMRQALYRAVAEKSGG